jgi:hypothetical protein
MLVSEQSPSILSYENSRLVLSLCLCVSVATLFSGRP